MTWAAISATSIGVVGGLISRNNSGGSQTYSSTPELTAEQKKALKLMLEGIETGKVGGVNLGDKYTGSMGSYNMTPLEQTGQSKLSTLLNTSLPSLNLTGYTGGGIRDINAPDASTISDTQLGSLYGAGSKVINDTLTTDTFDPNNPTGAYKGFKNTVLQELQDAKERNSRASAASGGIHSSAYARSTGRLESDATNQLTNKLGELYDNFVTRKQNAANTALTAGLYEGNFNLNKNTTAANYGLDVSNSGVARDTAASNLDLNKTKISNDNALNVADYALNKNNADLNEITASQQYGALQRQLETQKALDIYNEWMRARNEKLGTTTNLMNSLSGNSAGASTSYTAPTTSPWTDLFDTTTTLGTSIMGKNYANTGNILKYKK